MTSHPRQRPASGIVPTASHAWALLAILLFLLPVILIQREMYDGIAIRFAFDTHDFTGFKTWQYGQNWYLTYWFYRAMAQLGWALGVDYLPLLKIVLVATFAGLYFQYERIARELFRLPDDGARAVALAATLFPALQTYASSLGVVIPLYILAGLWGFHLLSAAGAERKLAGLVLALVAFQLNSTITFLVGLQIAFMLLARDAGTPLRRADYMKLAVLCIGAAAFLLVRKVLVPPSGFYSGYNVILLPTSVDNIKGLLRASAMFATWALIPMTVFMLASIGLLATGRRPSIHGLGPRLGRQRGAILATGVLWLFAIAPYVAAGKGPPLFTLTAYGQGITEQAIRSVYSGLFAPTFSATSGRHAVLTMLPLALAGYGAVALALAIFSKPARAPWTPRMALWLMLAAQVPWAMGAAWNRLQQQHAEIALVNGLRTLPPAPPGIVELRYAPGTDWLMHAGPGNQVFAQAWGGWNYVSFIYALDSYRLELHWQYVAGFRDLGGLQSRWQQQLIPVEEFAGERCVSLYRATLPPAPAVQVLLAGLQPQRVQPAQVAMEQSRCGAGQAIANPFPDRVMTY